MKIKDLLNPFHLIKYWLGNNDEPMPDEIKVVFNSLHELTQQSMMSYAQEANTFMVKRSAAGTRHSRRLYERKFNKVKKKFQDELQRLHQIETIMKENNIDIPQHKEESK